MSAETAMNLIGLILIAALSLGIVAVSLRLRLGSSDRLLIEGEGRPDEDRKERSDKAWLDGALSLNRKLGS